MSTTTALGTQVVDEAREALSRAVRQVIQALIPTLLVVAGGSVTGIDITAVLVLAVMTACVSLLRSVTGFRLDQRAPVWAQVADRAAAAAAGTALGLITAADFDSSAVIAWRSVLIASAGAAVLAVAMAWTNPPVVGESVAPADDVLRPDREPGQDGDF